VNQALAHNRSLKAAAARLREAQETTIVARASMLPSIGVSGNVADTERSDSDSTQSHSLNLAASWEPDLWGRLRNLTTAAEADEQAALEDYRGARLSLAANAAKAEGVRIFTVGFGSIDTTLLSMIASSPTDFFSAPTSSDLNDLFSAVINKTFHGVDMGLISSGSFRHGAVTAIGQQIPQWDDNIACYTSHSVNKNALSILHAFGATFLLQGYGHSSRPP
jgi:hypothetical protein